MKTIEANHLRRADKQLVFGSNPSSYRGRFRLSRCDQTRTLCDQTRTACAIKGGQTGFARVFRSRSVAKAEENLRLRLFPCTLER
jgi:hypothetical protein